MTLDEELNFENFKFRIGDVVVHKSSTISTMVVVAQCLVHTSGGVSREYLLRGKGIESITDVVLWTEEEIEKVR